MSIGSLALRRHHCLVFHSVDPTTVASSAKKRLKDYSVQARWVTKSNDKGSPKMFHQWPPSAQNSFSDTNERHLLRACHPPVYILLHQRSTKFVLQKTVFTGIQLVCCVWCGYTWPLIVLLHFAEGSYRVYCFSGRRIPEQVALVNIPFHYSFQIVWHNPCCVVDSMVSTSVPTGGRPEACCHLVKFTGARWFICPYIS